MKLSNILHINLKKLKTRPKKAMFLIIPVSILITLSIVISSQVQNIRDALGSSVFDTISDQYTLLTVKTEQESFDPSTIFRNESSFEQNRFSPADIANVESIDGVKSASLQSTLPITSVGTSDLFSDKEISLNNISTLDTNAAKLYTTRDFTYTEGQPIPIILSAKSFQYTYEDWSSGDTVTVDMGNPEDRAEGGDRNRMTVEKTEAIDYSKDDLIGKTFTISFGGLEDIRDYTTEMDRDTGQITITKLSEDEYNTKVQDRKDAISQYWDYDKISTPLTYTFVVAGIDESEDSTTTYLPTEFANTLVHDYISNEITSRVVSEIPTDVLNSDFLGLTYNGDELSSGFGGMMSQIGGRFERGMGRPTDSNETAADVSFSAISIPGLVIDIDSSNSVTGTTDNSDIYTTATQYADSMSIVLTDVGQRSSVIKALNKAGYAYQDLGDLDVFVNLEKTLGTISTIFLASFVVLVGSIVVLTMGKVVSESTREIGIFRAIGMRKGDILVMFISQSLLYIVIGYVVGILLGIAFNFISSAFVSSWYSSFISETVSQSFNVVNDVNSSLFTTINWNSIAIYSILLFVISMIVSILPSLSASKISPVEAIKNE